MNSVIDVGFLRKANAVAKKAKAEGNTPFGAILVDDTGKVLMEQGNAEKELNDATAHAELLLASRASRAYGKEFLRSCTLYSTCEPCPMCSGGIYWANIGRVVFGITEKKLLEMTGSNDRNPTFSMGADKVFAAGQKKILLEGPFEEVVEEICEVHREFWVK